MESKTNKTFADATKRILERMAKGEIPWRDVLRPKGSREAYTNRFSGRPYSVLNRMLLGRPGEYATWNQIKEHNGNVMKGAKGTKVILNMPYIPEKDKELAKRLESEGKDTSHLQRWLYKSFTVFHTDDMVGIEPTMHDEPETIEAEDPTDIADMAVRDYSRHEGVKVRADADNEAPKYIAATDSVEMPEKKRYELEEDYWAQLFGCLARSTAKEGRLDNKREWEMMMTGEPDPKGDLMAEITSSLCMSVAGLKREETAEQQAAVCQKWMKVIEEGSVSLIVSCSKEAEKAARLILGEFAP